MTITLTIAGDPITPEVAQVLQALGVALQGGTQQLTSAESNQTAAVVKQDPPAEPAKKTARKKKDADPIEADNSASEQSEDAAESPVTLESLREKVLVIGKSGKMKELKEVFKEFGFSTLGDAKKEDYSAIDEKLSNI